MTIFRHSLPAKQGSIIFADHPKICENPKMKIIRNNTKVIAKTKRMTGWREQRKKKACLVGVGRLDKMEEKKQEREEEKKSKKQGQYTPSTYLPHGSAVQALTLIPAGRPTPRTWPALFPAAAFSEISWKSSSGRVTAPAPTTYDDVSVFSPW